ncbi:hypothetical protein CEE37_13175 [candidate division LCP-89 bacterium B3_LCP]|uniref:F5/8 type C domain-containing protein n=1 Tax=candidate division LCP-89 bacterium B3_LCP TaxID=2012998 RepID=A0A532USK0_UNCL8|nr:MAG: hypothetical protein CEE37_13175 [candidate division LCP-89 bacterium B3_LCP]
MKTVFVNLFILLNLFGFSLNAQVKVIKNDEIFAEIVVDGSSDSLSLKAAKILQSYLFKITGVHLNIQDTTTADMYHIFIGNSFLATEEEIKLSVEEYDDAFILCSKNNNFYLAGKKPMGDIYAVYALLEEYMGCMKFTVDEKYIPSSDEVSFPEIDKVFSPAFPFRVPHFPGRYDPDFREWHRISTLDDWGMFVHTFQHLVPPGEYFKEHPEYFALVGNRRLQDGQLCLSNRDLMRVLIDNLGKRIEEQPDKIYWSVSTNDCINYCECENCQKLYEKYGTISGAYIQMANEIARTFPDKQISTLAYQFTRTAPVNIVPLDNVNIMFCSIECNRSMSLADDPRSTDFVKDMKDWSQLTNNIFAWDYVVQFKNYLTPFPNFHVLQPNIRFFRDHNVNMMFQQGNGASWSDLSDIKQYLIAKLLWDPEVNVDSVVTRFINKYYGEAAPYIRQYYDLTHQSLIDKQQKQDLNIYGFPVFYTDAHLTPQLLIQYQQIMDRAESVVQEDNVCYERVLRARIPADFAYLDIGHNTNNDLIKWTIEKNGKVEIDPLMIAKLDRFVELCERTGIRKVNERGLKPEEYRNFVLRKLDWQTKKNKLQDAEITLLTKDSPKYPVGGAQALNDRLIGGLEFQFNWLGFEDEDMIVLVDLKEQKEFSRVQMNFLKAFDSWVFLPLNVKIEVSNDGEVFHELASMEGDNSDRSFLVKSIPFLLTFDKTSARYIKITAISMRTCPEWHRGYGKPSWIFTDEIVLE